MDGIWQLSCAVLCGAALLAAGCSRPPGQSAASGGNPFAAPRQSWQRLSTEHRETIDQALRNPPAELLVVIHSTGFAGSTPVALNDYHRRVKGDPAGTPYHFLIGDGGGFEAGGIRISPRMRALAEDGARGEQATVHVGLSGDFTEDAPRPSQLAALDEILDYLAAKTSTLRVRLHRETEASPRGCPGTAFPVKELREAFPE